MQEWLAEYGSERTVWAATLVLARLVPSVLIVPFLTVRGAPVGVRVAVLFALTVVLTPFALSTSPAFVADWIPLWIVRELIVGTVFALALAVPFFAFEWAGYLADLWRGASFADALSSGSEGGGGLGELKRMLGVALFATLGGHRVAVAAMVDSITAVPVGRVVSFASIGSIGLPLARLVGDAMAFSASIAAPVAAAIILVEVSFGLAGRVAPAMPLFFVGMPARAVAGIVAVLFALSMWLDRVPAVFRRTVTYAVELLRGL